MNTTTNWDSLSQEEQNKWNALMEDNKGAIIFWRLMRDEGCFYCRHKTDNAEAMVFHLYSTHGIHRELLPLFYKQAENTL